MKKQIDKSDYSMKKKLSPKKKVGGKKEVEGGKWQNKATLFEKKEIQNLLATIPSLKDVDADQYDSFNHFPLSANTKKGLQEAGYKVPTKIQNQSLVHSLRGVDVVAAAKTGSGKTLAFLIPLLESLYIKRWSSIDGLGAIIITPTRELAYQIFEVLKRIGKLHVFSAGLVIGGKDLRFEWQRISSCNILICTPGRLIQHMSENPQFDCINVQLLILDEADQCLSMGFADQMNMVLDGMPKERQTLLFSATQTRDVKALIRAGCRDPIFISCHEYSKSATPKKLSSSYYVCEEHDKMKFLWSFLRYHRHYKVLVFFATCKQVKYFYNLFCKLHPGLSVLAIHGDMHQLRRMAVYDRFCEEKQAVLFATDVAARGLDIPSVNWVVQLDCPEDVTTYIHRVGRTARYSESGESLLVLTPSQETEMVKDLQARNIPIESIATDDSHVSSAHVKIEAILGKYNNLKEDAVRAFKSYLKNIYLMKNKRIFDVSTIDADAFARSLGLAVTPRVRFIERNLKKRNCKSEAGSDLINSEDDRPRTTLDFNAGDSGDDDEDFLTRSRSEKIRENDDKFDLISETQDSENFLEDTSTKTSKIVTKYALAKKAKKRNVPLNTKKVFDDEGNAIVDPLKDKVSKLGKDERLGIGSGGLNIVEMKEVLKAEDKEDKKFDYEKKRERRRKNMEKKRAKLLAKRKGETGSEELDEDVDECEGDISDYSVDQDFIDQLPDPDKIYGPESSNEETEQGSMGSIKAEHQKKETSRKGLSYSDIGMEQIRSPKKAKRRKWSESEASSCGEGKSPAANKKVHKGKTKSFMHEANLLSLGSDEEVKDNSDEDRRKDGARPAKKRKSSSRGLMRNSLSSIGLEDKEELALMLLQQES